MVEARDEVAAILAANPLVVAPNIVPRIGVLAPEGARTAIRELFLSHVIGGKHLSSRDDFLAMVQGATPDVVLTGVELLAEAAGDTVVVDVGGATTDVHSVVELDPEDAGLSREVVATTRVTRTVEGDLGMRWSAVTTAEAAGRADLADGRAPAPRRTPASSRPTTPRPTSTRSSPARPSVSPCAATPDAARSWSAPRDAWSSAPARTCARSTSSSAPAAYSGTAAPASPSGSSRAASASTSRAAGSSRAGREVTVDADYVLAAVGLLAGEHPDAARRLVRRLTGRGGRVG